MSVFRNKKQPEKTTPKNKSVRELCKEANKQIIKNAAALAEALCQRVLKDGSPMAMEKLIQLTERMKFGADGEEEQEPEESNYHRTLLDQWENEPEWTEADEAAAEVASINHELETWQSLLAAEPDRKETNEHDPQGSCSATVKPAGVVTSSGFVVYQGAAAPAPTETKAVDSHER